MIPIFSHASSKKSCVSQHSSAASSVLRTPSSRLLLLPGAATTPARRTAPFVGSKPCPVTLYSKPPDHILVMVILPLKAQEWLEIPMVFPAHFPWKLAVDVWKHTRIFAEKRWIFAGPMWKWYETAKGTGNLQEVHRNWKGPDGTRIYNPSLPTIPKAASHCSKQ